MNTKEFKQAIKLLNEEKEENKKYASHSWYIIICDTIIIYIYYRNSNVIPIKFSIVFHEIRLLTLNIIRKKTVKKGKYKLI